MKETLIVIVKVALTANDAALQVTIDPDTEHPLESDVTVTPVGNTLVRTTLVAINGPLLVIVNEYVPEPPEVALVGPLPAIDSAVP